MSGTWLISGCVIFESYDVSHAHMTRSQYSYAPCTCLAHAIGLQTSNFATLHTFLLAFIGQGAIAKAHTYARPLAKSLSEARTSKQECLSVSTDVHYRLRARDSCSISIVNVAILEYLRVSSTRGRVVSARGCNEMELLLHCLSVYECMNCSLSARANIPSLRSIL